MVVPHASGGLAAAVADPAENAADDAEEEKHAEDHQDHDDPRLQAEAAVVVELKALH